MKPSSFEYLSKILNVPSSGPRTNDHAIPLAHPSSVFQTLTYFENPIIQSLFDESFQRSKSFSQFQKFKERPFSSFQKNPVISKSNKKIPNFQEKLKSKSEHDSNKKKIDKLKESKDKLHNICQKIRGKIDEEKKVSVGIYKFLKKTQDVEAKLLILKKIQKSLPQKEHQQKEYKFFSKKNSINYREYRFNTLHENKTNPLDQEIKKKALIPLKMKLKQFYENKQKNEIKNDLVHMFKSQYKDLKKIKQKHEDYLNDFKYNSKNFISSKYFIQVDPKSLMKQGQPLIIRQSNNKRKIF